MNKITSLHIHRLDNERQIVFKKLSYFDDQYAADGTIMRKLTSSVVRFRLPSQKQPTKQLINKIKRVFSITGAQKFQPLI
jgi:hypothetical protein